MKEINQGVLKIKVSKVANDQYVAEFFVFERKFAESGGATSEKDAIVWALQEMSLQLHQLAIQA